MLKEFILSFLILISIGIVFGIGFHPASEVLPGTFSGNYNFLNGNIGIGTNIPIAKIHIRSESNQAVQFDINTVNGPGGSASISLRNYNNSLGNSNGIIGYNSAGAMVAWIDFININHNSHGTQSGAISFSTENNGVQNQRMRITQEGNVGIGTTSPIAKLSVAGNITAEAICDETGSNCNDLSNGLGGPSPQAYVRFNGANGAISSSYNVASVTRTNTGRYTINFQNALADTNYLVVGSTSNTGAQSLNRIVSTVDGTLTTSDFDIYVKYDSVFADQSNVNIIVY